MPVCGTTALASQVEPLSFEETTFITPLVGVLRVSVLLVRFVLTESESIPFGVTLQLQHSFISSLLSKTYTEAQRSPAGDAPDTVPSLTNRNTPSGAFLVCAFEK